MAGELRAGVSLRGRRGTTDFTDGTDLGDGGTGIAQIGRMVGKGDCADWADGGEGGTADCGDDAEGLKAGQGWRDGASQRASNHKGRSQTILRDGGRALEDAMSRVSPVSQPRSTGTSCDRTCSHTSAATQEAS